MKTREAFYSRLTHYAPECNECAATQLKTQVLLAALTFVCVYCTVTVFCWRSWVVGLCYLVTMSQALSAQTSAIQGSGAG